MKIYLKTNRGRPQFISGEELIKKLCQGGQIILAQHDKVNWHIVVKMPKNKADDEGYRWFCFEQFNTFKPEEFTSEEARSKILKDWDTEPFYMGVKYRDYTRDSQVLSKVRAAICESRYVHERQCAHHNEKLMTEEE